MSIDREMTTTSWYDSVNILISIHHSLELCAEIIDSLNTK